MVLRCSPPAARAGARGDRPCAVASKSFTESVILGEIAVQLARAAGAPAEHRRGLGGTRLVWDALRRRRDRRLPRVHRHARRGDPARARAGRGGDVGRLRAALAQRGLVMSAPLGFNNTYALGMREDVAARLGIRTISDLARHPAAALRASATSS